MFGECHAHMIMDGLNYRRAIQLHKKQVQDSAIREHLRAYERREITFVRDGGDAFGVSKRARELAGEYGIDYRSPIFAIHKNGYYGSIVGLGFSNMKEYAGLVDIANAHGCDFIKIMISGIMDLDHAGELSCESLPAEEIKEMIHIAHEYGLSVMAHTNGIKAASAAAQYGVDSIEHGNFIDRETMEILAEHHTLYVPTVATVANLIGCGRYPDTELSKILDSMKENLKNAWELQVPTALGSDAGAYLVPHGQGLLDEYHFFQKVLGESEQLDTWLSDSEALLRKKFCRP
ncbi:MAG: amidohydrolase family protein [Lachnospiraceae bacterium]|nr:amidohydrolase family protein [Lachnospiraceae bacterium]